MAKQDPGIQQNRGRIRKESHELSVFFRAEGSVVVYKVCGFSRRSAAISLMLKEFHSTQIGGHLGFACNTVTINISPLI